MITHRLGNVKGFVSDPINGRSFHFLVLLPVMIGMQPSRTKRVTYALLNTHFCPIVDGKYLMETGPSVCPTFTHISQIRKWSSPSESHSSKDKNIDFPFLKMGRNIKM